MSFDAFKPAVHHAIEKVCVYERLCVDRQLVQEANECQALLSDANE